MIELLIAIAIGAALGIAAGLLPGIHPNNNIPIILSLATLLEPLIAAIILITAGIVNSFVVFIPSILLGAPEAGSELGVLPGHRLLLAGRGYEAIKLTVIGGLGAVLLSIAALPVFAVAVPPIYLLIRPQLHWLLAAVVIYMVLSENGLRNRALAATVFLLSGSLGFLVLDVLPLKDGLFPLLAGLFGLPTLLIAIRSKTKLPDAIGFEETALSKRTILSGIGIGSAAGIIAGLLPGVGSSSAAVLAQEVTGREQKETDIRRFLIALGGIGTADVLLSLLALWLIGNPRSGIAVAVGQLVQVDPDMIMLFIAVILAAAGIGAWVTLKLARRALLLMRRINYHMLCAAVAVFIAALVAVFSGMLGLVVLAVAVAIGLVANLSGVRRSHAMGCLLVPTIIFFAGVRIL